MLNNSNPYFRQVELLLAVMPLVGPETCFALKGGSAINLFVRDLPRISVDLDLTFLPVKDRAQSLAEMIAPQFQPLEAVFDAQFKGMTSQPISVAELEETRRALVVMVQDRLTDAQRKFLFSFKQGEPEWPLLSVPLAEHLPAVQWKLINIRRMTKKKHAAAAEKLKKILFG